MRFPTPLTPIIISKLISSGGGGSVTPASIVTATGQMTAEQKAQTRANIGATDAATSIPDNVKQAFLACFADVAWVDDQGQARYDALEAALYPLDHITAVYTQSGTVYDTDSLDSLKTDLVVTAVYEGGNTETIPAANYTLSGTLEEGTSVITVTYIDKSTTFNVVVTHYVVQINYVAIGEPTVADNLLTIEQGKYFRSNYAISPTSGQVWKVRLKLKYTTLSSGFVNIVGGVNSEGSTVKTFIVQENSSHQFIFYVSADKSSWTISNQYTDNMSLAVGTWYYVEFGYDGSNYYCMIYTGGWDGTLVRGKTYASNVIMYGGEYVGFGMTSGATTGPSAQYDLTECKIYVADQLVWSAIG